MAAGLQCSSLLEPRSGSLSTQTALMTDFGGRMQLAGLEWPSSGVITVAVP